MSVYTDAVKQTWQSIVQSDTMGALRRLACPVLVVWGTQPWLIDDDRPYFDEQIVRSQVAAARHAELVVATKSTHAMLVRDPETVVVDAMQRFLHSLGGTASSKANGRTKVPVGAR